APLLDERALDRLVDWPRDGSGRAEATRSVRAWRPELAFVLPASFSSAWLAWRSGARERVGFASEARDALLTTALPRAPRGERHLADEFMDLGAARGLAPAPVPPLRPTAAGEAEAGALLRRSAIAAGEPHALIGPRSAYGPAREWFADRFAAAGRALVARGMRILVCGTAAEREACERVAAGIGPGAVS